MRLSFTGRTHRSKSRKNIMIARIRNVHIFYSLPQAQNMGHLDPVRPKTLSRQYEDLRGLSFWDARRNVDLQWFRFCDRRQRKRKPFLKQEIVCAGFEYLRQLNNVSDPWNGGRPRLFIQRPLTKTKKR